MGLFWKSAPRRPHSPTIVNQTNYSIVVFQERGFLYNQQILLPGEAMSMTPSQTTGNIPLLPYHIHAVIGDERALPTRKQSMQNLVSVSVIPAAFCAAALATAMSAGTLAGPSAALAPLVTGMVVNGVVIDGAAIAAGAVAANRAAVLSDMLLKKHPNRFLARSARFQPGKRMVIVTGGMEEGNLAITPINEKEFRKLQIVRYKEPQDTIQDKIHYYVPMLAPKTKPPPKLAAVVEQITNAEAETRDDAPPLVAQPY
jgi:hypothetical protein